MWDLLLNDPVAWGSILGLGIMVVMAGYYLYLFLHNTNNNL